MSTSLTRSLRALRINAAIPLRTPLVAHRVSLARGMNASPIVGRRFASDSSPSESNAKDGQAQSAQSDGVTTKVQSESSVSSSSTTTNEGTATNTSTDTATAAGTTAPSSQSDVGTNTTDSSASSASISTSASSSSPSSPSLPSSPSSPPSSSAPASSSSSSVSSSSSPSTAPSQIPPHPPSQTPQYTPILPYHPVPRPSALRAHTHQNINFPTRVFGPPKPSDRPETLGGREDDKRDKILAAASGLSQADVRGLKRYTVRLGRVTQMTKKGKMPSFTALIVVGSPTRGLVGIGWGRGATAGKATDSGFSKAVQSMDYVNRYENRTVWGEGRDLENKWGAVKVLMRARPAGFGLMVPPALHRVFTACGIRDVSATIEGSRNPVEVVKCAIQMLHGGANPPGFGSGLNGSRGRREDKGRGMRSRDEIERERGRSGVDVGLRA